VELVCYLLTAIITARHPAAQQYTDAAAAIPPDHWKLVQRDTIWGFPFGAEPAADGEILLHRQLEGAALPQVVGHLVGHVNGDELQDLWTLIFWYEGRALWRTVSQHAASSPTEHFAESYRWSIEGRLQGCCLRRSVWMRKAELGRPEYKQPGGLRNDEASILRRDGHGKVCVPLSVG
jgi:hypothetical protein